MTDHTHSVDGAYKQLPLAGMPVEKTANGSVFSDSAFAGNKTQPVHRWVPWIAGFSSEFVREAIGMFMPDRGTVLDPFSGVGTTLVETLLMGHDAVGFEINPYAALASRVKANVGCYDARALHDQIARFRVFYDRRVKSDYEPESSPPKGFRTRSAFYSPKVLRKVLILQDFIQTIRQDSLRELFRLAFASTMVRYSNYSYEPSLGRRVSAGKPEIDDFPVADEISGKLGQFEADILWYQNQTEKFKDQPSSQVINASFFDIQKHLQAASADLIVTSPPYLNNYHYNRNTRPQLYWLGYASQPRDLKPLEHANFGKYWQTVRDLDHVELDFSLPDADLDEKLRMIRAVRPDKGIYGGNGWANYAASYFNDCLRFARGIDFVLKPGGTALVVIGNSILQGITIPTDEYFGQIAEFTGLKLVDIHVSRETRVGNSIIQSDVRVEKAKDNHQLYEAVVEIRKTG
jgi:hypothetical protein